MNRMAGWVTGHARLVLAGVLLATVAAIGLRVDFGVVAESRGSEVLRLRIDPLMRGILPKGDEGRIRHDRMRAIFGKGACRREAEARQREGSQARAEVLARVEVPGHATHA